MSGALSYSIQWLVCYWTCWPSPYCFISLHRIYCGSIKYLSNGLSNLSNRPIIVNSRLSKVDFFELLYVGTCESKRFEWLRTLLLKKEWVCISPNNRTEKFYWCTGMTLNSWWEFLNGIFYNIKSIALARCVVYLSLFICLFFFFGIWFWSCFGT